MPIAVGGVDDDIDDVEDDDVNDVDGGDDGDDVDDVDDVDDAGGHLPFAADAVEPTVMAATTRIPVRSECDGCCRAAAEGRRAAGASRRHAPLPARCSVVMT